METKSALYNHGDLDTSPATSPCSGDDLKMMIAGRDREIQCLREEVHRLQHLLHEVQERTANHIMLLQQQLTNKTRDIEILQTRLHSQQNCVKIKAELSSLQSLKPTTVKPSYKAVDVCSISDRPLYSPSTGDNGPSVDTELKTTADFHQDWLSEPSGRSSSSSSSSLNLNTGKEEQDITHLTSASCMSTHERIVKNSISDEDDDVYNIQSDDEDEDQLDTIRITQQVKDFLQMHNIGQRVFGHCVLGLSQGTVSDILSRPKPWNKLTIRGREPFIRMKNFLSNKHNIPIVNIIRDGQTVEENYGRSLEEEDASEKIREILEVAKHEMHLSSHTSQLYATHHENSPVKKKGMHSERLESPTDFVHSIIQKVQHELDRNPYPSINPLHPYSPSLGQGSFQTLPVEKQWKQGFDGEMSPVQKTSLEEGLMPTCHLPDQYKDLTLDCSPGFNTSLDLELDTFSITKRVKDILTVNNIGQRLFGEAVLGLTQSTVSELLSHPKPWPKLSVRGKENFIRMNLWLQDPQNVQKLNTMKMMDQRDRLKRSLIASDLNLQGTTVDTSGDELSLHHSGLFHVSKRPRVVLSYWEKEALKTAYQREPYPSQHTINTLASQLNLKITTVSNWFYNHRSRSRQDTCPGETASSYGSEHTIQSPASLSSVSDSSVTGLDTLLIPIKQEQDDSHIREETEYDRDEEHNHYVSVAVQYDMKVKQEREDEQINKVFI